MLSDIEDHELYESPSKSKRASPIASPGQPYFMRNFNVILNHVLLNSYNHLLFTKEDMLAIENFTKLQVPSQQLYVRLFLRKHQWFPSSKIQYDKIAVNLNPILQHLALNSLLINEDSLEDLEVVLNKLPLSSLKSLCKDMKPSGKSTLSTKASSIATLLSLSRTHRPLFGGVTSPKYAVLQKAKQLLGPCYRVAEGPRRVFQKCVLLFSQESTLVSDDEEQNERQQLIYQMLQVDMGKVEFPAYCIIVTRPLFSRHQEFNRYYEAYELKQELLSAIEQNSIQNIHRIARLCIDDLAIDGVNTPKAVSAIFEESENKGVSLLSTPSSKRRSTVSVDSAPDIIVLSDSSDEDLPTTDSNSVTTSIPTPRPKRQATLFQCTSLSVSKTFTSTSVTYQEAQERRSDILSQVERQKVQSDFSHPNSQDPSATVHPTATAPVRKSLRLLRHSIPNSLHTQSHCTVSKVSRHLKFGARELSGRISGDDASTGMGSDRQPSKTSSFEVIDLEEGPLPAVAENRLPPNSIREPKSQAVSDSVMEALFYKVGHLHGDIFNLIVEYLEKKREYRKVCEVLRFLLSNLEHFGNYKNGHWFERLALDLDHHLKKPQESLEVIKESFENERVHPGRKYSLWVRAQKICKTSSSGMSPLPDMVIHPYYEKEILGRTHPHKQQESNALFVNPYNSDSQSYEMIRVEQLALLHYKTQEGWTHGVHAEGSAFSTLFSLLFWDIIFFEDVPDVFRSKYQNLPLDFNLAQFYTARKDSIDKRLSWLRKCKELQDIAAQVEVNWKQYQNQQCGITSWSLMTAEEAKVSADGWLTDGGTSVYVSVCLCALHPLKDKENEGRKSLVMCMGGKLLANIAELFCKNNSHYHGGLPDLTLWNVNSFNCKFVEVKGPKDSLSSKQTLWLSRLVQWGCQAEVCRVKVK